MGFGFANVVVAVPRAWIDVSTMADLDDVCTAFHARHHRRLRVATKYLSLTRAFFAAHGIGDYRIVESLGATEGAPAAGTAEAIVDITTTGTTLAANDLKVLDDGAHPEKPGATRGVDGRQMGRRGARRGRVPHRAHRRARAGAQHAHAPRARLPRRAMPMR